MALNPFRDETLHDGGLISKCYHITFFYLSFFPTNSSKYTVKSDLDVPPAIFEMDIGINYVCTFLEWRNYSLKYRD